MLLSVRPIQYIFLHFWKITLSSSVKDVYWLEMVTAKLFCYSNWLRQPPFNENQSLFQLSSLQKQPSRGVLRKRCSENMRQIYRRTPMPKCDFKKVAKQLYWNHTSAWVFSCKFAAYIQNTFFQILREDNSQSINFI